MLEEVIKERTSSIDLSARVLLLETRVLFLEAKLSNLEKQSVKVVYEPEVKSQTTIYGPNKRIK